MSRTFEELAGEELDALYQGALFLSGGDDLGAERLIVDTVTLAFQERTDRSHAADVERWLEARLARAFLRHVRDLAAPIPPEIARRLALDPAAFAAVGPPELFRAASAIPPLPRACLWLVFLRRWTYADAAEVLGITKAEVSRLLAYRDLLIKEMLGSGRGHRRAADR